MNPVGKQARNPSHIFYTPCTGIWQSVSNHLYTASVFTDILYTALTLIAIGMA